jgi:hypothetical protein
MMPQAGAIFAIRGVSPANSAFGPSVWMIWRISPLIPSETVELVAPSALEINAACRRVFSVSNGMVIRAAIWANQSSNVNIISRAIKGKYTDHSRNCTTHECGVDACIPVTFCYIFAVFVAGPVDTAEWNIPP